MDCTVQGKINTQKQTLPSSLSCFLSTKKTHKMLQSACHKDKHTFNLESNPTRFILVSTHYYTSVADQENAFHSGNIVHEKVKALN